MLKDLHVFATTKLRDWNMMYGTDRVISPFREGFIFAKTVRENFCISFAIAMYETGEIYSHLAG